VTRAAWSAAFVLFPSFGIVQKYFRTRGALCYGVAGAAALVLAARHHASLRARIEAVDRRTAYVLTVALLVALVGAFAVLYPMANAGERSWLSPSGLKGGGSDRDEALNLGAAALLHGHYPYYVLTQLSNPISDLPGSLLLAAPFVLLGNAAWQNIVWFAVYLYIASRVMGDVRWALALGASLLLISPVVAHDLVTGGDLGANTTMVLSALLLLRHVAGRAAASWQIAAASAWLGLTLSSRLTFFLLLPLLAVEISHVAGVRRAAASLLATGLTAAAITLPFYVHDPGAFSPLIVQNKFAQFGDARLSILLPGTCVAFSLIVAAWPGRRDLPDFLVRGALVLLMPVALMMVLTSIHDGGVFLISSTYGLPAVLVGTLGILAHDVQPRTDDHADRDFRLKGSGLPADGSG
jgi:hypothetical protein